MISIQIGRKVFAFECEPWLHIVLENILNLVRLEEAAQEFAVYDFIKAWPCVELDLQIVIQ